MKFRTITICVFILGVSSCTMALLFNWSRNQVVSDPDFAAGTTLVNDENFSDVLLTSEKPVVMDFYGDYCLVCRKLNPKLLNLAKEYSGTAVFARVNVQDAPELIQRYQVKEVPTLVVVHQEKLLFQGSGLSSLALMQNVLEVLYKNELR